MKLIWHTHGLLERDWLLDLFGNLVEEEVVDRALTCFDDDSIHVMSSISTFASPAEFDAYFRECRVRCRNLVLFHASDEWFSGGYGLYRHFDHVIRTHHTYLAAHDGVLTIPLGYPNETPVDAAYPLVGARRYAWSFIGQFKASRIAMCKAFDGLKPELVMNTNAQRISKSEFDPLLRDTIFAPCPMGNVMLETWRLYESLELGCIPLIEKRPAVDYYTNLFGPNPIPAFYSWNAARRYAEVLLADRHGLNRAQGRIRDWWIAHKDRVRAQVRGTLNGPSQAGELRQFADYIRNRQPAIYQPLRLAELLRHQSIGSLWQRLVRRGPLQRIMGGGVDRSVR
jgi:hypothetical protein